MQPQTVVQDSYLDLVLAAIRRHSFRMDWNKVPWWRSHTEPSKTDRKLLLESLKYAATFPAFRYWPREIQGDQDFLLDAVARQPELYTQLPPAVQRQTRIAKAAVMCFPREAVAEIVALALQCAPQLWDDREVRRSLFAAVMESTYAAFGLTTALSDEQKVTHPEIVVESIHAIEPNVLEWHGQSIPDQLWQTHRGVAEAWIRRGGPVLAKFKHLCDDQGFWLLAARYSPDSFLPVDTVDVLASTSTGFVKRASFTDAERARFKQHVQRRLDVRDEFVTLLLSMCRLGVTMCQELKQVIAEFAGVPIGAELVAIAFGGPVA